MKENAMLLRSVPTTDRSPVRQTAYPLPEAGLTAYQRAMKERLPLAHIAEQTERPQYWFAKNILLVLGAFGTQADGAEPIHLTRDATAGLELVDDMTALTAPGESTPRYTGLHISSADLEKYMEWARTVY